MQKMLQKLIVTVLHPGSYADWLANAGDETARWAKAAGFRGGPGEYLVLPGSVDHHEVVAGISGPAEIHDLAGLARIDAETIEFTGPWNDEIRTLALGYAMAAYRFGRYQATTPAPRLIVPKGERKHHALVRAVNNVRDWVNTPSEDMGPQELEDLARGMAEDHGADLKVTTGDDLLKRNLPAIHAVGRAADRKPRLIDLSWGNPAHPKLILVGKGVTFDCGGLNIKGAAGMRIMKKDMGGAAHAMALAGLVMDLHLPVCLRLLVPAVENAISGNAYRPGDVVTGRNGKTMEIGNTDAEGRVVLSDALTVASESSPDIIIDFATLTGAARIALGPELPPYYTTCDRVAQALEAASASVSDPLWRMPLYDPYEELIKSSVADISNTGSTPMGGSITAALFLRHFVTTDAPWVHLDVYAWNPSEKPGRPAGGEAQGLRAVYAMLEARYQKS